MKLSLLEKCVSIAVFLLAAGGSLLLADNERYGWYFVAVVLIALAWLALQLPRRLPATVPLAEVVELPTGRGQRFEVPVQFSGEAPLVFDRLTADGWSIGGAGPVFGPGLGMVVLEVTTTAAQSARAIAGRAVRRAGADVRRVGAATPA